MVSEYLYHSVLTFSLLLNPVHPHLSLWIPLKSLLDHKSVKLEAKILSVVTQRAPPIPGVAFINLPLRVRTVESFPQILNPQRLLLLYISCQPRIPQYLFQTRSWGTLKWQILLCLLWRNLYLLKKRWRERDTHAHFVLALIVDTHFVSSCLYTQAQTCKRGIVLILSLESGNENVTWPSFPMGGNVWWKTVSWDHTPPQGSLRACSPEWWLRGAAALHLRGESLPSAPGVLSTASVTITAAVQRPLGIRRATIPDIIESKGRSNSCQHSSNLVNLVNSLHRIKVYGSSHVWQDWKIPEKGTNQHWSWNISSVPGQTLFSKVLNLMPGTVFIKLHWINISGEDFLSVIKDLKIECLRSLKNEKEVIQE